MILIVVPPKHVDLLLRVLERREPMHVQTFLPEPPVERFDGGVVRGLAAPAGGMSVSDAKRLKELKIENGRLKRLLAESLLERDDPRSAANKIVATSRDPLLPTPPCSRCLVAPSPVVSRNRHTERRASHMPRPWTEGGLHLTARRLRDIAVLDDHDEQRARFRDLVGDTVAPSVSRRVPRTSVPSRCRPEPREYVSSRIPGTRGRSKEDLGSIAIGT